MIYILLDWFFVVFHTLLIFFVVFGWLRKGWLRYNLIVILLTGGSWLFLGLFYGLGYCPLTDWHFEVLEKLGKDPGTHSYVAYITERILGIEMSDSFADTLTLWVYLLVLTISVVLNINQVLRKRKHANTTIATH